MGHPTTGIHNQQLVSRTHLKLVARALVRVTVSSPRHINAEFTDVKVQPTCKGNFLKCNHN
jgi:hypothetical protein